ncbi:MAG: hypothetical protein ACRBN8_46575 [Nannocystales bacterium]
MSTIDEVDKKLAAYISNVATVVATSIQKTHTAEHSMLATESRKAFKEALQKYVETESMTRREV